MTNSNRKPGHLYLGGFKKYKIVYTEGEKIKEETVEAENMHEVVKNFNDRKISSVHEIS